MPSNILNKPLLQILQLIRNGAVTTSDVIAACAQRIQDVEVLNCFAALSTHNNKCDVTKKPLCGIPFSVKDNYCTRDFPTTCGSLMLKDFRPAYNATVVEKLLNAGGTLMGKNNLDEFGMGSGAIESIFGPSRNPWNYNFKKSHDEQDWRVAGGSSGGSAVAVATGASFFSLGSDTGGSVRLPAAFCGVVGLKPTYGSVSRHGLITLMNSSDVPGVFAKSIDDVTLVFNLLSGHDPMDSTTRQHEIPKVELKEEESVDDLVVGIPKEYHGRGLSEQVLRMWDWAAGVFSDAGAKVVPVSLPHTEHALVCYHVLCSAEVASNESRYDGLEYGHRVEGNYLDEMYARSRSEGFNKIVQQRIVTGNYFLLKKNYEQYCEKAMKVRRLISDDFKAVFSPANASQRTSTSARDFCGVDVLLTPLTANAAPRYKDFLCADASEKTGLDQFLPAVNLAGVPAVSVPAGLNEEGLPLALQLITSHCQEQKLLRAAKFLEANSNFPRLDLEFS